VSLWVLDTDHVSLLQQVHPVLVQRVATVNPEDIAVTVITAEEQMRGWLKAIGRTSQSDRVIWAYAGLRTPSTITAEVTCLTSPKRLKLIMYSYVVKRYALAPKIYGLRPLCFQ
jgi:hypothetical protein